jgi:hypothetical protein
MGCRLVGVTGYNIYEENIFIWVGVLKRSKFLEQKSQPVVPFFKFFLEAKITFFVLLKHDTIMLSTFITNLVI